VLSLLIDSVSKQFSSYAQDGILAKRFANRRASARLAGAMIMPLGGIPQADGPLLLMSARNSAKTTVSASLKAVTEDSMEESGQSISAE